jgi:hypothetical protein
MKQLRLNHNEPLYHKKENIMVLWQAKAGCTMVKKMFFHHEGKLEEILKKHPWIHNFNYSEYSMKTPNENTKIIQFVRCPFERAVSSYIHVQKHFYAFKSRIPENLRFCSFLDFLKNFKDMDGNIHYNKQKTTYKNIDFYKIEELDQNIQSFNKRYGLNYKKFESTHYAKRTYVNSFLGDKSWKDIENCIPEKYTYFYDDNIRNLVEELYQDDIVSFGYSYEEFLKRNS